MRAIRFFAVVAALQWAVTAHSSLPLGLTQVSPTPNSQSKLAVLDEVAYVSNNLGVTPIASTGASPTISASSGVFNDPVGATRVVQGVDGQLYVGLNYRFGGDFDEGGSTLFRLSNSAALPVTNWDVLHAVGFDSDLQGIGCILGSCFGDSSNRRLLPDGTESLLPELWVNTVEVTQSGLVIGNAGIAGTLGSAAASLDDSNDLTFLTDFGSVLSARERLNGEGINFAWSGGAEIAMYYGDQGPLFIDSVGGDNISVLVSQSEFIVAYTEIQDAAAFFPGINPAGNNFAVPLLDYFPSLSTLDFDEVTDIASADGQIHLLLSGNDGLWLYTAADPTVVPEPSSWVFLITSLASAYAAGRRQ